jgi:predicted permease
MRLITVFLIISIIDAWTSYFGFKLNNAFGYIIPFVTLIISFNFVSKSIVNNRKVDIDTVISAISGYILVGMAFGILFYSLELIKPGNFTNELDYFKAIYFSFATISTLGYGDISPITQEGRSLVIIATLIGQFYMVIIMGIIVGKFISNKKEKQSA